jgi:hypothetical protein
MTHVSECGGLPPLLRREQLRKKPFLLKIRKSPPTGPTLGHEVADLQIGHKNPQT